MRFLLDTNILIPLEDSTIPLNPRLANFVRLAQEHAHPLVFHPASEEDINRDRNTDRKARTQARLAQYSRLDGVSNCPWNTPDTHPNDACDNAILYAIKCDAAHYLITEDREIHRKAVNHGLGTRVFAIQAAEDFLRRLHEPTSVQLPNIEDVPLYSITPLLSSEFFNTLREGYAGFDDWFCGCARNDRRAWAYWAESERIGALCIYARKENDDVTGHGNILHGASLKLCTFKVAPDCQGRKIGELFLKAAFRYATENRLEHIFIHGDAEKHSFLFELLADFGFTELGSRHVDDDVVYVKKHPVAAPNDSPADLSSFEYFRRYFPHFRQDRSIKKFIIPIRPEYHRILFSDYISPCDPQMALFDATNTASNAIKQAYLCHAQLKKISPGDVVLFYRSKDERAVTSIGIVERYETLENANEIADRVRRRTVYSMTEIEDMARKPTKVMLFRLVKHFVHPLSFDWLTQNRIVNGNIQTIREIDDYAYQRLISQAA